MSKQTGCQRGDGIGPPPEWPQDRLERFWRGLGAEKEGWGRYVIGKAIVARGTQRYAKGEPVTCKYTWYDPTGAGEVPLEVLHKGLEKLAWKRGYTRVDVCCFRRSGDVVYGVIGRNGARKVRIGNDRPADIRVAIIAAIELMEVKSGRLW